MTIKDYRTNDFETRREYFKDWFYMLAKYKMFAGLVYLYFPEFSKRLKWTKEQALWAAFLNSASQNPNTTFIIMHYFPEIPRTEEELEEFRRFHAENQSRLAYDTDRRYFRTKLVSELEQYLQMLDGKSQWDYFAKELYDEDPEKYFKNVHGALGSITGWGRLTTWSATEFFKILGQFKFEWNSFFMNELSGSKSQRNGYLKSVGRDEEVWDKRQGNGVETHSKSLMADIEAGAQETVQWLREEFKDEDFLDIIGPETVETAFCSFKNSFFGRRYVNCYVDMSYFRIKKAEEEFPDIDFNIFWEVRKEKLPDYFLLENHPENILHRKPNVNNSSFGKQLQETGIPYNMQHEFPTKYSLPEDKNV